MDKRVSKLMLTKQYKQLSPEWFSNRKNKISASSAASLLIRDRGTCEGYVKTYGLEDIFDYNGKCCNPYQSKLQYYLDKTRGSTFKGSAATFHGQKYESVIADIYSKEQKKTVLEFGLINHPTIEFLAASPDGITEDGVMLEIKAPYRRKITGIPPIYYYFQTQLQMEVCDLDTCDFLEIEMIEFCSEEEWLDDDTLDRKWYNRGLFVQIEKLDEDSNTHLETNEYIYPPKKHIDDVEYLKGWAEHQMNELPKSTKPEFMDKIKISVVYWKVVEKCITTIKRDREWFKYVLPVFEKEWNLIKYYKKGDNYKALLKDKIEVDGNHLNLEFTDDETTTERKYCALMDDTDSE